jgi:integrase/recombinase XerD
MNLLLAVPAEFSRLLQQQNASPRTIDAYRDTCRLSLNYAERERGMAPAKLILSDFEATLVLAFLAHLETERHNAVRSRNARLAAVRAFAR